MNAMHPFGWMIALIFLGFTVLAYARPQPSTNAKGILVTAEGLALDADGTPGQSACVG